MITLEFPCNEMNCEGGRINKNRFWKDKEPEWIVCHICQGTGKQFVNVACLVMREVNYGDHGDTQMRALDLPDNLTLKEFLQSMYNPQNYSSNNLLSITFSKAERYMPFGLPDEMMREL